MKITIAENNPLTELLTQQLFCFPVIKISIGSYLGPKLTTVSSQIIANNNAGEKTEVHTARFVIRHGKTLCI